MSTTAVSNTSPTQQLQQYFQTRHSDLQQLGQALGSGDVAGAQTAYSKIISLGQKGPFAGGNPFYLTPREQDFKAVGTALQAGDLAGAQQAFTALRPLSKKGDHSSIQHPPRPDLKLSSISTRPTSATAAVQNRSLSISAIPPGVENSFRSASVARDPRLSRSHSICLPTAMSRLS